jgi:hypothetical protein
MNRTNGIIAITAAMTMGMLVLTPSAYASDISDCMDYEWTPLSINRAIDGVFVCTWDTADTVVGATPEEFPPLIRHLIHSTFNCVGSDIIVLVCGTYDEIEDTYKELRDDLST